ncbi:hypothetical protein [Sporosarcina sp. FSL W7-1283]|uniref:hypothetical protein n=1 Tax=Sporosarcina sp. FSL W7-1283 TaxID=2921560 RepID=UPI0030FC80DA
MSLVKVMTDLEALEHCIEKGVEEANSLIITYNRRGRFDNMKSVASLQKLLEMLYEEVDLLTNPKNGKYLTGKNRRHVVNKIRDKAIPKEDRRKDNKTGQPPTEDQLLMSEFIHGKLIFMVESGKHMEHSLNGWVSQFDLLDIESLPIQKLEERIEEAHKTTDFYLIKPKEIVRIFKDALYNMNISLIEKSFNILNKCEKIKYAKNYNIVDLKGQRLIVDKYYYDKIVLARMNLLKDLGSSINEYNFALRSNKKSARIRSIVDSVSEMLASNFECKFIYQSYAVISVEAQNVCIEKESFDESFWNDFIRRTDRRQRLYDSKPIKEQTWFWRKLYAFNTLSLIEYMGFEVGDLLVHYELENKQRVNELSLSFEKWLEENNSLNKLEVFKNTT